MDAIIIAMLIVLGSFVSIGSMILYFEYRYDKRALKKQQLAKHFFWFVDLGLKESAYIVFPDQAKRRL